ncbi:MAG: HyaD/HybD family hydrogenase maturation endopeptidase [Oricola sp.]
MDMPVAVSSASTLVLGIGNLLLTDDGFGPHVIRILQNDGDLGELVSLRDGGTIGLSLLTDIEDSDQLIVVDAAELGEAPGTLRLFIGPEMDRQLGGNKKTAHEVALADLMSAARLSGCEPARRALVAVQPGSTSWGMAPGPEVGSALPAACRLIRELIEEWRHE